MNLRPFDFCILDDVQGFTAFERGLYELFYDGPDRWFGRTYRTVEPGRATPPFSYDDMTVYGMKIDGQLVVAMAFLSRITHPLQLERLGFELGADLHRGERYWEGLAFYSRLDRLEESAIDRFMLLRRWGALAFDDMRSKGVRRWFGTCSAGLVSFYKLLGCRFLAERALDGAPEHLFEMEL